MAKGVKKVTEYSKAKDALETARENLDAVSAKASANGAKDMDKKAAEHAQKQFDTQKANVQRLGFKQIGGARTTKAIVSIRAIAKLANRRAYNFGEADAAKINTLLLAEVSELQAKFSAALTGTTRAKSDVAVSFD